MDKKYCCQIGSLPKDNNDIYRADLFKCKITGVGCVASTYEDPDPGHPASMGCEAKYNDATAQRICPAYNISDALAGQIIKSRLEVQKSLLEKKIGEIESESK